jgi:hypothetical protein
MVQRLVRRSRDHRGRAVITDQQGWSHEAPATVRRRRVRRLLARRRRGTPLEDTRARPTPAIVLSEAERRRRLDQLAAYLVRTMRSCPAPGIAPLTTRDWLLMATVVLLPYLIVFGLAALAPAH